MNATLLRLAAALLLCLVPPAAAQGLYVHPESNLKFPARLAEFQRDRVHAYDDPGLGVSASYVLEGLGKADIYVYDLGERQIPSGIDSALVRSAFAGADRDVAQARDAGRYLDFEYRLPAGAVLTARNAGQKLLVRSYRFRVGSPQAPPLVSWLALTGYGNKFLKIRFSHAAERASEGEDALSSLVEAFFAANPQAR